MDGVREASQQSFQADRESFLDFGLAPKKHQAFAKVRSHRACGTSYKNRFANIGFFVSFHTLLSDLNDSAKAGFLLESFRISHSYVDISSRIAGALA